MGRGWEGLQGRFVRKVYRVLSVEWVWDDWGGGEEGATPPSVSILGGPYSGYSLSTRDYDLME